MNGLSVLMPAFNEADRIIDSLSKSLKIFSSFGVPFEIIVVNDGSTDNTAKKIRLFSKKHPQIKLVSYRNNKGKGHALKHAFSFAKMSFVTFVDADLELNPIQLKIFFDIMRSSNSDIVVGSKRHPDSKLFYPFYRKFLSNSFYLLTRVLFGLPVKDSQAGLKLFKKSVLDDVFPRIIVKGYAFDLELLVVANTHGYKIAEAPIDLRFARFTNRVGLKAVKNILIDTLGVLYRLKVLHFYG